MPAILHHVKKFICDETGSYTIEFVVLVPLLLAALVFSFEFARAFWAYDVMTRDVRAGVRYFSRAARDFTPPDCPSVARTLVTNGTDAVAHFPWNGGTPTFTCNKADFNTGFNETVHVVTMTGTVPVALSFLSFLNTVSGATLSTAPYTLSVSDQARLIGN